MITIYPNFYTMTPYYVPIDTALMRIREGKSKNRIEWVMAAQDQKELQSRKKKLPCILFSGQFGHRHLDGLIGHSGWMCVDFDKFSSFDEMQMWRDSLEGDNYTYSVFTSPSGKGLKCLVKIPAPTNDIYRNHKAYFRGLQSYYDTEYFDVNMFDYSRICYESYDPELQINSNSQLWTGQIFDPEPVKVEYNKASLSEMETARRLIKWSDRKFPIVAGNRNANLFRLCCSLNDFGIDKEHALSLVSVYQADDFKLGEIVVTLNSAYKKTSKHGSLKF